MASMFKIQTEMQPIIFEALLGNYKTRDTIINPEYETTNDVTMKRQEILKTS
jgi:hypothetical protein